MMSRFCAYGFDRKLSIFSSYPKIESGTSRKNDSIGFELIGFEAKSNRFWVIANKSTISDKIQLNKIILDVFSAANSQSKLDSVCWNVSFFASRGAAGYKTFKPNEYLGEYSSKACNEHSNTTLLYPMVGSKQKRIAGPKLAAQGTLELSIWQSSSYCKIDFLMHSQVIIPNNTIDAASLGIKIHSFKISQSDTVIAIRACSDTTCKVIDVPCTIIVDRKITREYTVECNQGNVEISYGLPENLD